MTFLFLTNCFLYPFVWLCLGAFFSLACHLIFSSLLILLNLFSFFLILLRQRTDILLRQRTDNWNASFSIISLLCPNYTCIFLKQLEWMDYDGTYILQISVKLAKEVFLEPILSTWGGFMTNFLFSPATMSGFLALMISNTLSRSCNKKHLR